MTNEIENAIKILSSQVCKDMKSEDALRYTQAALNLAHVLATVWNSKKPALS